MFMCRNKKAPLEKWSSRNRAQTTITIFSIAKEREFVK